MATPYWGANSKAWDQPTIAGKIIPGVVHLKQASIKLRVEPNKTSGKDGGGTTLRGLEIPQFQFDVEIRDEQEHTAWDQLVPIILPRKNAADRVVLPVYHPSLARYGQTYCIVEEVGEVPPWAGGNLTTFIRCIAAMPKKSAPASKPKPSATQTAPTITLPDGQAQARDIRDYVRRPSNNVVLSRK